MKSRANIKSHAIHPILVGFPIAFFTGTLLFDVLAVSFNTESFFLTALYLNILGIFFALLAAVPGIIDHAFTLPPDSTAKKRGTQHGLLNGAVVLVFAFVLFLRHTDAVSIYVLIGLEVLAMGGMSVAGWMGGTLVSRNQIGVDIRYAHAGKWKELFLKEKNGLVEVGKAEDLKTDQMWLVHVKGKRIVIAKTETEFVAFDDRCTHRGGSLAAGAMICGTVQCPWHGSQFDVKTGEVKAGPAKEKIATYTLMQANEVLYLNV